MDAKEFDTVYENLTQVHAMLELVYGEGMENFSSCSDEIRDVYLWACADRVSAALEAMKSSIKKPDIHSIKG